MLPMADAEVMAAYNGHRNPEGHASLSVAFSVVPVRNERKSDGWREEVYDVASPTGLRTVFHAGAGRDIYEDQEFIEIRIAGNLKEVRCRPVRDSDKKKWPIEYRAFKEGLKEAESGTPLSALPFLRNSPARIEELKFLGIRTVESLAGMAEADAAGKMGIMDLKNKAMQFLDSSERSAPVTNLQNQVASQSAEIAALKAQLAEISKAERKGKDR